MSLIITINQSATHVSKYSNKKNYSNYFNNIIHKWSNWKSQFTARSYSTYWGKNKPNIYKIILNVQGEIFNRTVTKTTRLDNNKTFKAIKNGNRISSSKNIDNYTPRTRKIFVQKHVISESARKMHKYNLITSGNHSSGIFYKL